MTEHDIQNLIRLELSKRGFAVFRANVGKIKLPNGGWFDTGLPKGFTDLFAVKFGKIYFMEVKTPYGIVSENQQKFIERMKTQYKCCAGVVRSVEDAIKLVEEDLNEID